MPWLSAGGVTTIFSFDDVSVPGLRHIAEIPNRSSSPFHVYQNTRAAERIAFVRSWEFVESDTEAFQAVMVPENDPRYHAVLQAPPVRQWGTFFGRQQEVSLHRLLEKLQNSSLERPRSNSQVARQAVNIEQQYSSAKAVHISLAVESDGILVFSEPFYPGWKIFVDGQAVPILRANYAFSGIFLAQGRHDVKRIYRPSSVMFGGILSLVFLGLLIIGGYIKKSIV
ncbi:MAG: YfhO family protein [bacterium]|nr:YfhO family protein [bacterium]